MTSYLELPSICKATDQGLQEEKKQNVCMRNHLKDSGKIVLGSVMVNYICQLEWAMGCLDIRLKIVYGMSVSMFLKNINI